MKLRFAPVGAILALLFSQGPSYAGLGDDLPASEFNALVAFFESTGGQSWNTNTDWLDPNADSWFGVTTIPRKNEKRLGVI